jgi:sensor histidine kinase YesM
VGLANTRARLQALYGERAALSLVASPGQRGVTASLRLPLQTLTEADRGAEVA